MCPFAPLAALFGNTWLSVDSSPTNLCAAWLLNSLPLSTGLRLMRCRSVSYSQLLPVCDHSFSCQRWLCRVTLRHSSLKVNTNRRKKLCKG